VVIGLLLLGLVVTASIDHAGAGDLPKSLRKLDLEELLGQDLLELEVQALDALHDKRYQEAAEAYLRLLERRPGEAEALYNLACCYSRLGAPEQAAELLAAAWQAGFRDLEQIRRDPDLEDARISRSFRLTLQQLEAESARAARWQGVPLAVTAPVAATVRTSMPEPLLPDQLYPLLVILHGAHHDAPGFLGLVTPVTSELPLIVCAPQAPYASGRAGDGGYIWWSPEHTGDEQIERSLSDRYVLAVIEAAIAAYPVDPEQIFVLGFSQGAHLAYYLGLHHPQRFRGVIPVGGWLEPEHAVTVAAADAPDFLICHSREDRVVDWQRCQETQLLLGQHEVSFTVRTYKGGHVLPASLVKEVASWLLQAAEGKTPGPGSEP
jgi:phospholipase/carboxylesterase